MLSRHKGTAFKLCISSSFCSRGMGVWGLEDLFWLRTPSRCNMRQELPSTVYISYIYGDIWWYPQILSQCWVWCVTVLLVWQVIRQWELHGGPGTEIKEVDCTPDPWNDAKFLVMDWWNKQQIQLSLHIVCNRSDVMCVVPGWMRWSNISSSILPKLANDSFLYS